MSDISDKNNQNSFNIPLNMPTGSAPAAPQSRIIAAANTEFLDGLNDPQRQAVEAIDGPLLVLAGAGTGKTRVLTTRLAQIIRSGKARPYEILVVTFTNKAAREMRARAEKLIGGGVVDIWLGTFHALGVKILRRNAELVGLEYNFTILDMDDQIRLLKQVMQGFSIDEKRWPARILINVIQRWKDKGLTPEKVTSDKSLSGTDGEVANGHIIEIYVEYQRRLKILNAADFGDLLLHNLTIFNQYPDILLKYQKQFRYILVDEYQDTNISQYLWLRLLAQRNKNICCVGDDDQSIYGWRGAEIGNILKFEKDFPAAKIVRLELNYRSSGNILAVATKLIANNQGRLGKTLWTNDDDGELVHVSGIWDGAAEARDVGAEIENLQRKGCDLNQMAILVRAGYQTREFEENFIALAIPYKVIGGLRFYEREEIRDALAYLRVVHQPSDDLALMRIINKPARGIGDVTLNAMRQLAGRENLPLFRAAKKLLLGDDLKPAAKKALGAIMEKFDAWRQMADVIDHMELAETILKQSGYMDFWRNSKKLEAAGKLENLKEFPAALDGYENLAQFLEHVSLVVEKEEAGTENNMVSIMTLHAAKGLEFDTVFLPGWEEGLFPSQRTMDENGMAGLEEERRIAYVGITRARKSLYISFAANRRIHGQWQSAIPSRFIDELPAENTDLQVDQGLYSGSGGGMAEARAQYGFNNNHHDRGSQNWQQKHDGGKKSTFKTRQVKSKSQDNPFKAGDRCFHQKFGNGDVIAVDGDHLTIEFDKAGRKAVVAAFVEKPS